jgi:hypothetical protein|tara:strand:+ start:453 stop:653 length:201 start_codon:yes stop_codon:yes gene_type:complete
MVEKANGINKNNTIEITADTNLEQINQDLMNFLLHDNLSRKYGSLRKEIKVKTPFKVVGKWYQLNP